MFKKHELIAGSIGLASALILSFILWSNPAKAEVGCYVGGSAGVAASATRLSDENTRIDLGTSSPLVGAEVGCKLSMKGFSVGALARGDKLNAKTKFDTESLQQDFRWMVLGTVGIPLNDSTEFYFLGGFSGTKFEVPNFASKTMSGLVLGAGVSTQLMKTGLSIAPEYNAIFSRDAEIGGAKIKDVVHVGRLVVRYGF